MQRITAHDLPDPEEDILNRVSPADAMKLCTFVETFRGLCTDSYWMRRAESHLGLSREDFLALPAETAFYKYLKAEYDATGRCDQGTEIPVGLSVCLKDAARRQDWGLLNYLLRKRNTPEQIKAFYSVLYNLPEFGESVRRVPLGAFMGAVARGDLNQMLTFYPLAQEQAPGFDLAAESLPVIVEYDAYNLLDYVLPRIRDVEVYTALNPDEVRDPRLMSRVDFAKIAKMNLPRVGGLAGIIRQLVTDPQPDRDSELLQAIVRLDPEAVRAARANGAVNLEEARRFLDFIWASYAEKAAQVVGRARTRQQQILELRLYYPILRRTATSDVRRAFEDAIDAVAEELK